MHEKPGSAWVNRHINYLHEAHVSDPKQNDMVLPVSPSSSLRTCVDMMYGKLSLVPQLSLHTKLIITAMRLWLSMQPHV